MHEIGLKRLESQIRLIISSAMQNKLSDPRLERLASITQVKLTVDLSFANIYISVMGTDGQQNAFMHAMNGAHGVLQKMVARKMRTKNCPTLRFYLDQSIKQGLRTVQLIDKSMEQITDRGAENDENSDSIR